MIGLRAQAQALSRQLAERIAGPIASTGIDPNVLTIAGFVVGTATAVVIAFGLTLAGGVLVLVTGGFDMLDGAVARLNGSRSQFGAFLDSTLDRWAEGFIFTGLVWYQVVQEAQIEVILAVLTLTGSMLVSYTRARAEGLGLGATVGLLQRPERLILLGIGLLGPAELLSGVLWFLAIATALTAGQRMIHAYREIERSKGS